MNVKLGIIQPQMQMQRAQWVTSFSRRFFSLEVEVRMPITLISMEENWEGETPRELCFRLVCKS